MTGTTLSKETRCHEDVNKSLTILFATINTHATLAGSVFLSKMSCQPRQHFIGKTIHDTLGEDICA
jgi:hypothetical protein